MSGSKRYYLDEYLEYRSYGIFDLSKSDKKKEDYWNEETGIYDIISFEEYLINETDSMMKGEEVVDRLNEQDQEIQRLKKELSLMKDKAYYYGDLAIGETSTDFDKDMDELRKEIYGEEAEQIKQKEIKEKQESYQRLKE